MTKILILDDMEYWHEVVERNLRFFGFNEFLHAYTLGEGLETYRKHKPKLIFTDLNLETPNPADINEMAGNLDGLVLCEEARREGKEVKIVAMSSIDNAGDAAKKAGADYFIPKRALKEEIERFIKENYQEA